MLRIDTKVSWIRSSDRSRFARLLICRQEDSMERHEPRTHYVTFRSGIIVVAAMMVLAPASTARRPGVGALAATVIGMAPTPIAAAENGDTAIRPFKVTVPEADLAELRRRLVAPQGPTHEPAT